jgi:protein associated with RNAse G/E
VVSFSPGSVLVARENWRGYLHSADPCVVVSDDHHAIIEWMPAGTRSVHASSRLFPGREHLPRNERKLLTLETCRWLYSSSVAKTSGLNFVDDRHWSKVALEWSRNGEFRGWYLNFQRPLVRTELGYDSMDLVLDLVVEPDTSWHWKDEADFESAIERRILGNDLRAPIMEEAERLVGQLQRREGPFDPEWSRWRPPRRWGVPSLPPNFADGLARPEGSGRPEAAL